MRIILPPSETKAPGGEHPACDWDTLATISFPQLHEIRREVAADLIALCADPEAARLQLKVPAGKISEVAANAQLAAAPTMPALQRYTGVLYAALDAATLPPAARQRLLCGSALFGVVAGDDLIPAYRLSATSALGTTTLRRRYARTLTAVLSQLAAEAGPIVDLRSGGYRALGPVAEAITVDVFTVYPDGSRKIVSHFNKHHKGLLARELALSSTEPSSPAEVAAILRAAGYEIEVSTTTPTQLALLVPDPATTS